MHSLPAHSCKKWAIWSYRLRLTKPLAVLGENVSHREGWIVGRWNTTREHWEYGEVAPLPSFHQVSMRRVYEDLIQTFRDHHPPQTALVQTLFDVWEIKPDTGLIKINGLLGSNNDSPTSLVVKVKLGRQSLSEDCRYIQHLQTTYPQIQWRLDCNRQWSKEQLRSFWDVCDHDRILYIEDPLRDPREMIDCPEIPFALDESLSDYTELLESPNVVAAIIKPTLHHHWKKILSQYDIEGIFSSTFEGSLGIWGLGQLARQHHPHGTHGLGTLGWFGQECVNQPLNEQPGLLSLPKDPPTPLFSVLHWEDGV